MVKIPKLRRLKERCGPHLENCTTVGKYHFKAICTEAMITCARFSFLNLKGLTVKRHSISAIVARRPPHGTVPARPLSRASKPSSSPVQSGSPLVYCCRRAYLAIEPLNNSKSPLSIGKPGRVWTKNPLRHQARLSAALGMNWVPSPIPMTVRDLERSSRCTRLDLQRQRQRISYPIRSLPDLSLCPVGRPRKQPSSLI